MPSEQNAIECAHFMLHRISPHYACSDPEENNHLLCRRALGWLHAEQGSPLSELRLRSLLPSSDREGVSLAFDYCQFLLNERQVSPYTQGLQISQVPVML